MRPSLHTLASHAFATLPDSLAQREKLLRAVLAASPKGSEYRARAKLMLEQLKEHLRTEKETQLELALITTINAASKTKSKKPKSNNH